MKIVFMGTPEFAVRILDVLSKEHEIVLIVSQPDTYNYRRKTYTPSPVKEYALDNGLEVFQPVNINKEFDYILYDNATGKIYECRKNEVNEIIWSLLGV